jgi:energy-coupling factor transport system permease protein
MADSDMTIYQPGESILHRMNPVTEVVLATALSLVVFVLSDYRVPLALALVILVLLFVGRVHGPVLKLYAAVAVPFAFFLLLIQGILLTPTDPTPLLAVGPVTVWQSGFEEARLIFLRISVLILAFLLFATTAQPQRLRVALMEKGVPSKLAYVFIASLMIIPEIRNRATAITEAQQARGLDTEADVRTRLSSIVALLAPLLISTLIVANTRALALNARGFQATGDRTYLYDVPDPTSERLLRYLSGVAVIGAVVWRVLA